MVSLDLRLFFFPLDQKPPPPGSEYTFLVTTLTTTPLVGGRRSLVSGHECRAVTFFLSRGFWQIMMGWERHINMKVHLSGPSNLQMQASASWIWMIWCIICLSSGEMCNQCSWGSSKLNNLFLQFMFWCNFSRSLLCFLLDCRYLEQCIW